MKEQDIMDNVTTTTEGRMLNEASHLMAATETAMETDIRLTAAIDAAFAGLPKVEPKTELPQDKFSQYLHELAEDEEDAGFDLIAEELRQLAKVREDAVILRARVLELERDIATEKILGAEIRRLASDYAQEVERLKGRRSQDNAQGLGE